jgi:mitofilin
MFRALPVARQALQRNGGRVRISRRVSSSFVTRTQKLSQPQRFVTETTDTVATSSATPPKKSTFSFTKIVVYTAAATTTFYVGGAFLAFNNHSYHSFFQQNIPFAPSVLQYGEDHGWDSLTITDVIVNTYDGVSGTYSYVRKQLGYSVEEPPSKVPPKPKSAKNTTEGRSDEVKTRVQKAVDALKTDVKLEAKNAHDQSAKAAAIAKHQGMQFTAGVEDLVLEAEAALLGKPFKKSPPPGPKPEATTPISDHAKSAALEASKPQPGPVSAAEPVEPSPKNVYDVPLPLGHEPPPGFTRPAPPKPPKPLAPGEPLPLVAPVVEELRSSEPVLTHLAKTIDSLASFLNANPAAANKARDVLDVAKTDLSSLAQSFDRLREEERSKLEQSLDEQTREYTLKLLELELQAQDKLENQETDFRSFYEEEKMRFASAYREKLEQELRTQSDIINERFVSVYLMAASSY